MFLSIIITVLNDAVELVHTIESIRATTPVGGCQIIVVDDMSDEPLPIIEGVTMIRNSPRIGCAPSRHLGASIANGEFLLFTDSHMRFEKGWYEAAFQRISHRPKTLHCGVCLGLDKDNTDLEKNKGAYQGAYLSFYNTEEKQVLEGKWLPQCEDDQEISCVMGASYFIPRKFFMEILGLKALKMWGSDEPYLSMKVWLAGGDVRMMKTVRIGHIFRDNAPYRTDIRYIVYNKIRMCLELFDKPLSDYLISKLDHNINFTNAMEVIHQDFDEIESSRNHFKKIFQRDVKWFIDKFKIDIPGYSGLTRLAS